METSKTEVYVVVKTTTETQKTEITPITVYIPVEDAIKFLQGFLKK